MGKGFILFFTISSIIALLISDTSYAITYNTRTTVDSGNDIVYGITGSDLDGDGLGEYICLCDSGDTVEVVIIYEATADNTYGTTAIWLDTLETSSTGNDWQQKGVAFGDTDNDGNVEVIVSFGSGTHPNELYLYEMSSDQISSTNPSTTPVAKKTLDADGSVTCILIADLDGDSYPEIYVGARDANEGLEIWEWNGTDNWVSILTYDFEDGIIDIAGPKDLDGDGTLEIALISTSGHVGVLSFDGNSITSELVTNNIPSGSTYSTTTQFNFVSIFNVDNSGNPEIVVSQRTSSTTSDVRVYTSSSADTYGRSSSSNLHTGNEIQAFTVCDFDANGKAEIYFAIDGSDDNHLKYREWNGTSGSFNDGDFTTKSDALADIGSGSAITFIAISFTNSTKLLDGDLYRDMVISTRNNNLGDEIFFYESGSQDQSLPVTLTSFTATPGNSKVTLNWITESEVENLGFNIYRSLYSNEQFTIINDQLIPGHGNTSSRHEYQYIDRNVINGIEYWYQLEDVSYAGETEKHDIVSTTPKGREELGMIPDDFQLFPCYPNPFNPTTKISFNIPENSHVILSIIDLRGNLVITLIDRELQQNQYEVTWNGKDAKNRIVGNGVYLYQLTTNRGFKSTGKMVFLR